MADRILIGGTRDGERVNMLTFRHEVRIPRQVDPELKVPGPYDQIEPSQFEYETYLSMSIAGNRRAFEVLVIEGMEADEAIQKLIDGYHSR